MKTNKSMTLCPKRKQTFLHKDGHFTQNNTHFAETVGLLVRRALNGEPQSVFYNPAASR
jgi:hypothetical protein